MLTTLLSIAVHRRYLQSALSVLPLMALLLLFRHLALYAMAAPVSFDGAMNLNIAASLASGDGYGFFYDTFFPFAAQTDGPFILPAATLIRFFGVSPLVTQAVNLLYIGVLVLLLTALLKKLGLPLWAALAGVLMAVSVPGFSEFGMNAYGEIPALVWFLAGLLAFGSAFGDQPSPGRAFLGGMFLALAYLTKVVALALVGPLVAIALLSALRGHVDRKSLVLLCAGFILPIVFWETFRLISVGSLEGYTRWWGLQLGQIFHQSGAGHSFVDSGAKAIQHFSILCSITGLNRYLLTAFLVLPFALFLFVRDRCNAAQVFYFLCLLLSGFLYFSWWLLLTPTSVAWLRRILDGIIIHQVLLVSLGFLIFSSMRAPTATAWPTYAGVVTMSLIALVPAFLFVKNGQNVFKPIEVPAYSRSYFKLASLVRDLPEDAVIFGTGWWQAPGLALYSGRKFHNFQHWTPDRINSLKAKYFAFDTYTTGLARNDIVNALALTDTEELYKGPGGELYRVDKAKYYASLALTASDLPRLKKKMNFAEGDYEFKRGFYEVEDGKYAWMRTDGLVALTRSGERLLVVSLVVPDQLIKDGAVKIRVNVPECADETFNVSKPWENALALKLDCPATSERTPLYAHLHVDRHMPFVHQIDSDNRLLSVLVRSVGLVD